MARRSDPFNLDDWELEPNGGYRARYKDADLDWLIRQYPQYSSELARLDREGQPLTPLTVLNLRENPEVSRDQPAPVESTARIRLPGGFEFDFKNAGTHTIILVIAVLLIATYWVKA